MPNALDGISIVPNVLSKISMVPNVLSTYLMSWKFPQGRPYQNSVLFLSHFVFLKVDSFHPLPFPFHTILLQVPTRAQR